MFIDRHEQSDAVKNCKVFLEKIQELKPYLVEFDKNDTIKPKVYPLDYEVRCNNQQSIIPITDDKCTFFANNRICNT